MCVYRIREVQILLGIIKMSYTSESANIPVGSRPQSTVNFGLSREQLLESLRSSNPLRRNISYTAEQLFFLEYVLKYGLNAAHVRIYNETMEGIADFYTRAILEKKIIRRQQVGHVRVWVKYTENGKTEYSPVSKHWPHEFLKNRSISQSLVFLHHISKSDFEEIVTVPFMFGCKWCIIAGKTPSELHAAGENAICYTGYVMLNGTAYHAVTQEKIAHNLITTVYSDERRAYTTSLKTQDERNNSVEYLLYKGQRTRSTKNREDENTYFLHSGCFQHIFEATHIFKQIYLLLKRLTEAEPVLTRVGSYDKFMEDTISIVAGVHLKHFVLYDWAEESEHPIEPFGNPTKLEDALDNLYKPGIEKKNGRKETYMQLNGDLVLLSDYPEMVVRSIFPSIAYNASGSYEKRMQSKFDMYQGKAMLLMRMLIANVLTEQGVQQATDRNNVGNKAYLSAPELFRRDLTRDQGAILQYQGSGNEYRPRMSIARGDSSVFEALEFSNPFITFSSITIMSVPRCAHSTDPDIRSAGPSHAGYVCPYDTPSNAMVGLTTHTAMSTSFSVPKNVSIVQRLIDKILNHRGIIDRFPTRSSTGLKLLSVNSVPYALIDYETFIEIKKRFKRDYLFMDMAVIEDAYVIHREVKRVETASYNILADSARIYRPLYDVEELVRRNLLSDEAINDYLANKTLEDTIADGVITMVFPSELEFKRIAMTRSQVVEHINVLRGRRELANTLAAATAAEFAYCEIDPLALFGMTASCSPMINHSPGNRGMHEPAMAKSAITSVSTNIENLSEPSSKILLSGQSAPVTTRTNEVYSRYLANGVCAIMAIAIDDSNPEDAYEASRPFAESVTTERNITFEFTLEEGETAGIPEGNDYRMERYHNIDKNTGLPKIGEYRGVGDAIFAKYRRETVSESIARAQRIADAKAVIQHTQSPELNIYNDEVEQQIENKTIFIDVGKNGHVQKIKKTVVGTTRVYRITLSTVRNIEVGDKLASRSSQKGVLGRIRSVDEMPRIVGGKRDGLVLDLIFSPMSLTSRSTPGLVHELLLGNYAVATGEQVDASAFSMSLERLAEYNKKLEDMGYKPWGIEIIENPVTKQKFKAMVGVPFIRVLKHTAWEKQKACGRLNLVSMDKIQRAPSGGGPTGAIRGGYMDWDTFAAHSAPHMISAMFRDQSDRVLIELCSSCGHICDRCNRDPETVRDVRAATHCTKCDQQTIVTTKMPWCLVHIYFQFLSVGVKLSLFPGSE